MVKRKALASAPDDNTSGNARYCRPVMVEILTGNESILYILKMEEDV